MLRVLRAVLDSGAGPAAARRRQPGTRVRGRHRRERSPHVRRDGRRRQPRRQALRPRRGRSDPGDRGRPRPLARALRDRASAVPGQGQGARHQRLPGRRAHRRSRGGDGGRASAHRPRGGGRGAPGGRQRGSDDAEPRRRARRGARHRQVAPGGGAEDARGRVQPARGLVRALLAVGAVLRLAQRAQALVRNHPGAVARGSGGSARAVDRHRHARPRALGSLARDPPRRGGAAHSGGRRDRRELPLRPPSGHGGAVPAARPDDADAARLRGRALDGRRVAVLDRATDRTGVASAVARVRDESAGRRDAYRRRNAGGSARPRAPLRGRVRSTGAVGRR